MSKKPALIIDGQVFQSAAWHRGMGKYSLNLLDAISKSSDYDYKKTYVVFSKNLELSEEALGAVKESSPKAELVFLGLKAPKNVPDEDLEPLRRTNTQILDTFVKDNRLEDSHFLILSLFIDQVCSVFPEKTLNTLLFYDLIPLQYSERYSKSWAFPNYLSRFKVVFDADKILTISQTVADDLVVYLGLGHEKLQNIDGAPIDRGRQQSKKPDIKIPENFILMPSGNDLRKNNFRAVEAFEDYKKRVASDCKLVITSYFDDKTKNDMNKISSELLFTGNVSEQELKWLYENTRSLLFVSEYEGLGLPVLEAAEVEKPIVCSNLTVFNEMSKTAFYYADQHNPSSISLALEAAVNHEGFEEKREEYSQILRRYTWKNTAKKALNFLSQAEKVRISNKLRLAVFAPNPSGYSAIGKVGMLLHPKLNEFFDVDYYLEDAKTSNSFSRPSYLPEVANAYQASDFTALSYAEYDAVIYHIGNSEYHLDTIKNALHLPGYLIIHDTNLKDAYENELHRYGYMETGRLKAERALDEANGTTKVSYMSSLMDSSLGLVTHSRYAKQAIQEASHTKGLAMQTLNLPVGTPKLEKKKISNRFNVGFGGIIHKAKGLKIVDALAQSVDFSDISIYIFGVPLIEPYELERLNSYTNIKIEKNLSDFQFENRLSEMDAIVSYRPTYNGETSLTVIEAMRHGVIPIVRRVGWFDELPEDCVEKVDTEEDVLDVIRKLRTDTNYTAKKKQAAKKYVGEIASYEKYAKGLYEFITAESSKSGSINHKIANMLREKSSKEDVLNLIENP